MRQVFAKIILVAIFVTLEAAIVIPFIADAQFDVAQDLEKNYRWEKAREKYKLAIRIDPFNTKYLAGYGDFLYRQHIYREDRASHLRRAGELYEQALKLNLEWAECYVKLGQIQIDSGDDEIHSGIKNFKKALKIDPNGFNTSYVVGYSALSVYDLLDKGDKDLILDELKNALQIRPWNCVYAYPQSWKHNKDFEQLLRITPDNLDGNERLYAFIKKMNLWEFRKKQVDRINFYRQKANPSILAQELVLKKSRIEKNKQAANRKDAITRVVAQKDWQGKADNGKDIFINGRMYWNGTVYSVINTKPGTMKISAKAMKFMSIKEKNTQKRKFYPYILVKLDGDVIGETFVDNDELQEYEFLAKTDGGRKVLSVTFVNDIYNPDKGEDRNLLLGDAKISYE